MGCSTDGAASARTVGLAAGLPEACYATVIDNQCASGLDAIVTAVQRVAAGECECLLAGGAESVSTAPWRVSRPRSPFQPPNFVGFRMPGSDGGSSVEPFEADEKLAAMLESRAAPWMSTCFAHTSLPTSRAAGNNLQPRSPRRGRHRRRCATRCPTISTSRIWGSRLRSAAMPGC